MFDKQEFKNTFDQVHASEGLLTEVLDMTTKTEHKTYHSPKIVRTMLIAAVLICALTVTAVAADAFSKRIGSNTEPVIQALFGDEGLYASGDAVVEYDEYGKLAVNLPAWSREPVDMKVAERLVAPYLYTLVENSVTIDEFTYTIHAMLYDSNTETYMVRWSVENPNGLGDYGIGINGEFTTKEGSDMYAVCGGRDYVDTVNSTDTKLYISSFGVDWMDELWAEFGCWYDWDQGKEKARNETHRFVLPRDDYGGMQALTFDDGRIILSPVAVRFGKEQVDDLRECSIVYTDGSTYTLFSDKEFVQNTTYGLGDTENNTATYTFNRIVDVEQVSAIIVNGETFPVE